MLNNRTVLDPGKCYAINIFQTISQKLTVDVKTLGVNEERICSAR